MQPPAQTFPVLSFLGVLVQLGGAAMVVALFMLLRRFVLRRGYFTAWAIAWSCFAIAIVALVIRYILVPEVVGRTLGESDPFIRAIYFVYLLFKCLGLIYFLRGTLTYVSGTVAGVRATKRLWAGAAAFTLVSTVAARQGLNELVVWQSVVAVPMLGYCAAALLRLPRDRRTAGSVFAGSSFGLLAALWVVYAVCFTMANVGSRSPLMPYAAQLIAFNSYLDLTINLLLAYAMILILVEDAKRVVDDAQAQLRVTHDQLRRAALYDMLTDTLNRRAFADGVGLEIIRSTFGTVVLADLDDLKAVNDSLGHAAGDDLLRQCAEVLRATLRPYDKLYRWGGDEFLLLVSSAHASDVLQRLQLAIDTAPLIDVAPGSASVRLRVSLGAADYASAEGIPAAMEAADRAMYVEKERRKRSRNATPGRGWPSAIGAVR